MKYLKKYKKYLESKTYSLYVINIMESLNVLYDDLLLSISSDKKDFFEDFKLDKEIFSSNLDLDYLSDSVEFVNSLSSLGLKKSAVQNSSDFNTFLIKPCKFMFIYNIESNELENPQYIIIQTWIESLNQWTDSELYKVNDNIKKFYDKLTSKTIELIEGEQNWIYQTSNGTEWVLQNLDNENDIYVKVFRKEDFMDLIEERQPEVRII
jgi:hypothetical protein